MSQLIANACRKRRASKLPASVVIFVTYFSILQLVMCKAPTTGACSALKHFKSYSCQYSYLIKASLHT